MTRKTVKFSDFGLSVTIMDDFTVADAEKAIEANVGNRPKKAGAIKRYTEDYLRRKWDLTGETIIFDEDGKLINGQNRCYALLAAEKKRLTNPKAFEKAYGLRGPIKVPMVIVHGVKRKAFRSMDSGEKRTGPDMFFCANMFDSYKNADGKPFSDADKRKLSRILSTAVRTVWLRLGGKQVSDAPSFPTSEMEDFLKHHPALVHCVQYVYLSDNGAEQLISSLVSPAYLAAVMYLAAAMKTDRNEYDEFGELNLDLMPEAEQFVELFASGVGLEAGSPILALQRAYKSQIADKTTSRNRDVVLNMLVNAYVAHMDDVKNVDSKSIRWNPAKDEVPRIGGLDVTLTEDNAAAPEAPASDDGSSEKPAKKKTKKSSKKPTKKSKTAKKPKSSESGEADVADDDAQE